MEMAVLAGAANSVAVALTIGIEYGKSGSTVRGNEIAFDWTVAALRASSVALIDVHYALPPSHAHSKHLPYRLCAFFLWVQVQIVFEAAFSS